MLAKSVLRRKYRGVKERLLTKDNHNSYHGGLQQNLLKALGSRGLMSEPIVRVASYINRPLV